MRVRVIGIIELIQQFSFAALGHFECQIARPFHPLLFGHENQFRTVSTHRSTTLLAHVVRHQQLHAIAFQRRNHRQRNAGVAAGRFNQHVAGFDFPTLFRLYNHRQRRPVFNRTRRIIAFQFDPNFAAVTGMHTLQFDQRGVADGVF
ncbi:hypothetical protein D3C85_1492770 [compost metagenome]